MLKAAVILLAGGQGRRMGLETPKQFLDIEGKCVAQRALEPFLDHPQIEEIIIVCAEEYQDKFNSVESSVPLRFAKPGPERQDSLKNGLKRLNNSSWVMVHDGARPLFDRKYISILLEEASQQGAAAIGIRATSTLKQACAKQTIEKTIDRSKIWEIQTPQVARKDDLLAGLELAEKQQIEVTDDASLIELLSQNVKIVEGDSLNFKVTKKSDLMILKSILHYQKLDHAQVLT